MDREHLLKLASAMQADPSKAPAIARLINSQLPDENGGLAPPGYVYHGAHKLVSRVENLEVADLSEGSPPLLDPGGSVPSDPIKVPFDCIIFGVGGRASPAADAEDPQAFQVQQSLTPELGEEGRDLFACSWRLDGVEAFATDGRDPLLSPAFLATGTQEHPRALYWEVQRNQRIVVSYKNILSAWYGPIDVLPQDFALPPINAEVVFYCLNIEAP